MEVSSTHQFPDQLPGLHIATHTGHVRKRNEDSVGAAEEIGLVVLADGMGGHTEGATASRIAVEEIINSVKGGRSTAKAIQAADRAIRGFIDENPDFSGMGTTAVAAKVDGINYEVAWVGDSRAYFWHGSLKRLTQDHSAVQKRINSGAIKKEEESAQRDRNVLERALMGQGLTDHEIGRIAGRIYRDEILILCTDGLHGLADDEEISAVVESAPGGELAQRLVGLALKKGGDDNVSVAVVTQSEEVKQRPETGETIEIPVIRQWLNARKRRLVAFFLFIFVLVLLALALNWDVSGMGQVSMEPQSKEINASGQSFSNDAEVLEV